MTNRFIVRISSGAAFAVLGLLAAVPARADAPIVALYQGQTIRFTHVSQASGGLAVGVQDPGFAALLRDAGAWLTWKPGERYVLITTSVPAVVSFAIGDRRYDVGPIALQASFAPYERGNEVYLPLNELLGALGLALRQDGAVKILQPQLSALDVRNDGGRVTLTAHAGAPLHPRIVQQSADAITYAFDGVGTTLSGTRKIGTGGVRTLQISVSGSVRDPTTLVAVRLDAGTAVQAPQTNGDRDVVLSFAGTQGAAAPPQAVADESSPTPEPAPPEENAPAPSAALVTGVTIEPGDDGATIAIAVTGSAIYEWHRLRDPDNRFWVDIKNAQLQGPPTEQNGESPIISVRAKQNDAATVRIALSLDGPKPIAVTPSPTGLTLQIGGENVADTPRSGGGSLGGLLAAGGQPAAAVTPAPIDTSAGDATSPDQSAWKFGPHSGYVPTNPRLIVIDPGHGGSDVGTQHGGLREADLALDMAKRLRDLLTARGWEVKLTRETDVDVYAPNDSPHDELQARVNIANNAGARLFVSIHANAFINSGPYGTTCYISKPDDVALAHIVETHLAADGTKDDGVIKSHLYVTYHTRMPAVLIETAFLTNPGDYALLASSQWRQKVAQEIADGIGEYARSYPVPNQPAQ
ncbi:MAG TPA: N-acetylmuramoyl-L-alanine amidase [Candidatus Cybelea sp.]|nr:N-acetylmuramoyl-L-alanine amidase [Candidatus Cybelea sp.]